MNIWTPASVDDEPDIELSRWSVMKLPDGGCHFVGWCGYGRVSSQIEQYDKDKKIGITASGRKYQLIGEPGRDMDAEYVWECWKQINKVTEFTDVSFEY